MIEIRKCTCILEKAISLLMQKTPAFFSNKAGVNYSTIIIP